MRSTSRAVLAGSVLALLLAACGGSKNEKPGVSYSTPGADTDSKKNSLIVPPDLIAPARDDRYVVPAAGQRASVTASTYATPAATNAATAGTVQSGATTTGNIRIERVGNERWLVVQGMSTSALWPQLQNYWKDLGFVLVSENAQAGLMETEWAENHAKIQGDPIQDLLSKALGTRYSTGERDKYRLRMETTAQPGAVEIYISHRGMIEVRNSGNQDGTHWEPRANDPALEAEMLQRLMVRLGTEEKVAQKAVVEAKAPVAERAQLGNAADGVLQLTVNEPLDRAWRQLGLALDRSGVVVEDRDRAKSAYLVRYIATEDATTQKERDGWFARMFSWGSKKETGTNQFRVEAVADGQQTVVRLLNKEGAAAPAASAKQILGLLYKEMK
ncbi:outer membrane protein assembly factor BamC [Uliginosibacterium flavum]|uniref:Outer membrane protein assembly factor BamC n=1 Tax=Uliginosibacterium flavum TaxID=1396831 RepID=A0ABV2TIV0_9RHOO